MWGVEGVWQVKGLLGSRGGGGGSTLLEKCVD